MVMETMLFNDSYEYIKKLLTLVIIFAKIHPPCAGQF